jgi:hypothetical protein
MYNPVLDCEGWGGDIKVVLWSWGTERNGFLDLKKLCLRLSSKSKQHLLLIQNLETPDNLHP